MKLKVKEAEMITAGPRPVRPIPVEQHGFFGLVRQHMMMDERWTPNSQMEEYKKISELLETRLKFNKFEKKIHQMEQVNTHRSLRKECREGRSFLNHIKVNGDTQIIRNLLMNHRHMQRLYQHMSVNMVEENINQRTFRMRKERDRLQSRLEQLKKVLEDKLILCGNTESRIRYQNEFILQEEIKARDMKRKISNSRTRLEAVQVIFSTYKKIIQILRHDEIFYEPILHSLDNDIRDQENFIQHILFLGTPAFKRFRELSEQHRLFSEKHRRSVRLSTQDYANLQTVDMRLRSMSQKMSISIGYRVRQYVRETNSMLDLKAKLEEVETTIKEIKLATFSSRETEMYPRIKSEVNNNLSLISKIDNDLLQNESLETKRKCGTVLQEVMKNNFTDNTIKAINRVQEIKNAIKDEDDFQEETLIHIKKHSEYFVLLRFTLWNIHDILRHVGPRRLPLAKYPVDYLNLPLLKYEMLATQACPPDPFEVNIPILFKVVEHKLKLLMKAFDSRTSPSEIVELKESYCNGMLDRDGDIETDLASMGSRQISRRASSESNILENVKAHLVPSRKQIKFWSGRIVDDHFKSY